MLLKGRIGQPKIAPGRIEDAPATGAALREHHEMVAIPVQQRRSGKIGEGRAGPMARNKSEVDHCPQLTQRSKGLASPGAPGQGAKGGDIPAKALGPGEHEHAAEPAFLRRRLPHPAKRPHLGPHASTEGFEQAPERTLWLKLQYALHRHADFQGRQGLPRPRRPGEQGDVQALGLPPAMGEASLAHAPGEGTEAVSGKTF